MAGGAPFWRRALPRRRASLLALALLAALLAGGPAARAGDDVRWFDFGPEPGAADFHSEPVTLSVGFLSDCDGTSFPPRCGDPPARWPAASRPVALCSFAANRPAWLTEEQFRQALTDAAAVWNGVEAAVGISYAGDCASGSRWSTGNRVNEIGFDDDRNAVAGVAAGVTRTSTNWSPPVNPTTRSILEADIVLDHRFANLPACFAATVTHEMGHVLGFAHSDDAADLMYPTFSASTPSSCKAGPSASEQGRLQELYGVNRAPAVTVSAPPSVRAGIPVSVAAAATDPEGDAVTFRWTQVAGPPVALVPSGATAAFTAPAAAGAVQLRVTATDAYLHPASTTVTVTVSAATATGTGTIAGSLPPSGFGLLVFGGGTEAQLLAASGCPAGTAAFWASDGSGGFVTFVPGTAIVAVNGPWFGRFPTGIPAGTPLLGRCRL